MDQMEYIWAPWRIEYIEKPKGNGCILCQKPKEALDEANLILYRGQYNFIMLNAFPYNPGHLMVAPYRHSANLGGLSNQEVTEHFHLIKKSTGLLSAVLKPAGFNIGINIGKAAGAGIEDHLHTHVVPRWQGDTNFMPILSNTKVTSEALAATYRKLKAELG